MAIRTYIYADCLADLIVVHPFSVSYHGTACSLLQPLSLRLPLFLPDGGAKWRDCIMVSLTVHGRSLTAYPFTYPCPFSAAAALLALPKKGKEITVEGFFKPENYTKDGKNVTVLKNIATKVTAFVREEKQDAPKAKNRKAK